MNRADLIQLRVRVRTWRSSPTKRSSRPARPAIAWRAACCSSATSPRCIASSIGCAAAIPKRVDDLVHSTFVAAFAAAGRYRDGNVRGWLYGIAANLTRTYARKRDPAQAHARDGGRARPAGRTLDPDDRHLLAQTAGGARPRCLHDQRVVFVLIDLEGERGSRRRRGRRHPRGHAVASARRRTARAAPHLTGAGAARCPSPKRLAAASLGADPRAGYTPRPASAAAPSWRRCLERRVRATRAGARRSEIAGRDRGARDGDRRRGRRQPAMRDLVSRPVAVVSVAVAAAVAVFVWRARPEPAQYAIAWPVLPAAQGAQAAHAQCTRRDARARRLRGHRARRRPPTGAARAARRPKPRARRRARCVRRLGGRAGDDASLTRDQVTSRRYRPVRARRSSGAGSRCATRTTPMRSPHSIRRPSRRSPRTPRTGPRSRVRAPATAPTPRAGMTAFVARFPRSARISTRARCSPVSHRNSS